MLIMESGSPEGPLMGHSGPVQPQQSLFPFIWEIPPQTTLTTERKRPGPAQGLPAWTACLFHLLHFSLHLIYQPTSQREGNLSDLCPGPSVVVAVLPSLWPVKKSAELWIKRLGNKVQDELPDSFHLCEKWEVSFLACDVSPIKAFSCCQWYD